MYRIYCKEHKEYLAPEFATRKSASKYLQDWLKEHGGCELELDFYAIQRVTNIVGSKL